MSQGTQASYRDIFQVPLIFIESTHVLAVVSLGERANVFVAPIKELCLIIHVHLLSLETKSEATAAVVPDIEGEDFNDVLKREGIKQ
jgi:hypothetical protein